jgi:tripartite-type tricarboxylate transporter receptor subunit TctC
MFSRAFRAAAFLAVSLLATGMAVAQSWPTKPITILCGQPAGSGPDIMARIFGEIISQSLGQRILVSNRTGSGGIIAAAAAAQSPADGYTLLLVLSGTHTTVPAMQSVPFDPVKDFEFISLLYASPAVMLVSAKNPATNFQAFLSNAKSAREGLKFGSPAIGSPAHLMGAFFNEATQVRVTNVGYRGGGQILTDLTGGLIDFTFTSSVQALPQIAQGQVRALAIAGPARLKQMPDVPTLAELGYGQIVVESWFGLAAPKGTPREIIERLNSEVFKATSNPMIQKRAEEDGVALRAGPSSEFVGVLTNEYERLSGAVKRLGIKAE